NMARLNWKSDALATVIRPLPKGTGDPPKRHLRGNFLRTRIDVSIRVFRCSVEELNREAANVSSSSLDRFTASIVRRTLKICRLGGQSLPTMRALLALEDGRIFEGESFGATGTRVGEVCFNTSMTGYQEVLTDPSYRGQIVAMTYPLIGNYGTNSTDQESTQPHVRGFVIEELSEIPSNWRSEMSP